MKKSAATATKKKPIIAHRRACKASGTGLSHFILMDKNGAK